MSLDWMVNSIRLIWKFVCMLRTYGTCYSTVGFQNINLIKLLGGVTFFRITPGITWTQHVYIYI